MTKEPKDTKTLVIRMTKPVYELLKAAAKSRNLTMSGWARMTLNDEATKIVKRSGSRNATD